MASFTNIDPLLSIYKEWTFPKARAGSFTHDSHGEVPLSSAIADPASPSSINYPFADAKIYNEGLSLFKPKRGIPSGVFGGPTESFRQVNNKPSLFSSPAQPSPFSSSAQRIPPENVPENRFGPSNWEMKFSDFLPDFTDPRKLALSAASFVVPGASLLVGPASIAHRMGAHQSLDPGTMERAGTESDIEYDPDKGELSWSSTKPGAGGYQVGTINNINTLSELARTNPSSEIAIKGLDVPEGENYVFAGDLANWLDLESDSVDLSYGGVPSLNSYFSERAGARQKNVDAARQMINMAGDAWNRVGAQIDKIGGGYNDQVLINEMNLARAQQGQGPMDDNEARQQIAINDMGYSPIAINDAVMAFDAQSDIDGSGYGQSVDYSDVDWGNWI